ncbi:MAG: alpha-2,8-polysialyltransferase family protein [Cyclobacteriaceae bacterium]|nr:alpha-2,8-polysialyltransferase family protein [Cyclobacteriaceae bacterium]
MSIPNNKEFIVFIVHTEYHMLGAISIISDFFSNVQQYQILIIQTTQKESIRFRFKKDLSEFKHLNYQELNYDEGVIVLNPDLIKLVNSLLESKVAKYFSFNRLAFIDFLLIKELSKLGTEIILAPDGTAAYGRITSFTPRWSFKVLVRTYKFLWVNGFRNLYFYWPTLVYGDLKEIDELWVTYPDFVDPRARKKLRKVEMLQSDLSKRVALSYFGYVPVGNIENIIFYLNQPFRNQAINDFEKQFIKDLLRSKTGIKILIKLHPSTSASQREALSIFDNVEVLESTIPAELMISNLKNSIILSFWSTAGLVNNKSCRFYWLKPMLEERGIMLNKINIVNPTCHIKMVNSIDAIK